MSRQQIAKPRPLRRTGVSSGQFHSARDFRQMKECVR